jgi:hypothetical protein
MLHQKLSYEFSLSWTVQFLHMLLKIYKGVSKNFWTGSLVQELQMVQLLATRCSCITISWVSLVSFATIILCVASQQMFVVFILLLTQSKTFVYTLTYEVSLQPWFLFILRCLVKYIPNFTANSAIEVISLFGVSSQWQSSFTQKLQTLTTHRITSLQYCLSFSDLLTQQCAHCSCLIIGLVYLTLYIVKVVPTFSMILNSFRAIWPAQRSLSEGLIFIRILRRVQKKENFPGSWKIDQQVSPFIFAIF